MENESFAFDKIERLYNQLITPITMISPTESPERQEEVISRACENVCANASTMSEMSYNQLSAENKLAVMQFISQLHARETTNPPHPEQSSLPQETSPLQEPSPLTNISIPTTQPATSCLQTRLSQNPEAQKTEVYKPGPIFSKNMPYQKQESLTKRIEPYKDDPVLPIVFEDRPPFLNPPPPTLRFERETYIGYLQVSNINDQQPQVLQPQAPQDLQLQPLQPPPPQVLQPQAPQDLQLQPSQLDSQKSEFHSIPSEPYPFKPLSASTIQAYPARLGPAVTSMEDAGQHYSDEAEAVIMWEATRRRKRFPLSRKKPSMAFWRDCIEAYPRLLGGREPAAVQRKYERLISQLHGPRRLAPRKALPRKSEFGSERRNTEQCNREQHNTGQVNAAYTGQTPQQHQELSSNELPFFETETHLCHRPGST